MAASKLGIRRLHSVEFCVREAGPWLNYLTQGFGFQHIAVSTGPAIERTGTRRHLLRCADVSLVVQEAAHAGSFVKRYLDKRPEGISKVNFLVRDMKACEEWLVEHHGTPTNFVATEQAGSASWNHLSIATPLGDAEFCFIETSDEAGVLMPDLEPCGNFDPQRNPLGITGIDHLTANTRTLMPVVAFYEHVMGFKRYWDVRFHPEDFKPGAGGGLTSVVMWDEDSAVKFANNEPLRPRFDESQVQFYVDLNRGPGIQHVAFHVGDILRAVDHCREAGIQFLATPRAYYQALPKRIQSWNIARPPHAIDEMEKRQILLDGDKQGCLLQIFCKDQVVQFNRPGVGPLSIELLQRCGCDGFGEGNFRALFEAEHQAAGC